MTFADYLATRNYLYTGRASAAIYLVLRANNIQGAQVLLPANICYAAVLPVLYSDNVPVFADVGEDGNLTQETVEAVRAADLGAAVLPHMYGNPCRDIATICRMLANRSVLTIEDGASSMGARLGDTMTGTFADYAVYSFGYSKTIDCGHGGLIVSTRKLDRLAELNQELRGYDSSIDVDAQMFSQVYRGIRGNLNSAFAKHICGGIREHMRHCFLFKTTTAHAAALHESLGQLGAITRQRWDNVRLYQEGLNRTQYMGEYAYDAGAVPWRFNILVDERHKPALVRHLLQRRLAVSDWYPVISPMFGVYERFPQAEWMERRLLNFPLMGAGGHEIRAIVQAINEFWTGMNT